MSKAKDLSLAISARLAGITKANGYDTDIGLKVLRGQMTFDESLLPCTVLVEGDDDVVEQRNLDAKVLLRFIAEGHAECDPENPNDTVHDIISDLKRAIFGGDPTYGGLVRPSNNATPGLRYQGRGIGVREDGSNKVSASITFDCQIHETLTNP